MKAFLSTWPGRFIAVFLLAQLLLPLRYYVRHRDPHDERFAWRMFSPIRMVQCTPRFALDGKVVDLRGEFHEAWVEIASRGRFAVLEAMGRRMCDRNPGHPVRVDVTCAYLDGTKLDYGGYDMCTVPNL